MDFNVRQQNIIKANDKNILCLAAAGSGKTATLIGRINRLLEDGVVPSSIVAFTFTRQAAEEMRQRIGEKGKDVFIGTIHSYANKICNMNGIDTNYDIADEKFDNIIKKAIKIDWSKYPTVDYLFVDEFQDTDPLQYSFIQKIPTKNRFYVGDSRQFIYGFRSCTDKFIRELATDDTFKKYYLVEDYRNPPNILRYADDFLATMEKLSPATIPVPTQNGFLDECSFADAAEEITWTGDWVNWAVLCRTNNEVVEAQNYLNSLEVPNIIVKRGDLDLEKMNNLLAENRVKVMTIHSAKGLQFPNVIVIGARVFNEEERRVSYVAATRAMKSLYWCPTICNKRAKAKGTRHLAGDIFSKSSMGNITF